MEDKKLLCDEVIERWAHLIKIYRHDLACFLARDLPCYSFSKFAWYTWNLANPPSSSADLWNGKSRKWLVKQIINRMDDLYLLESDVLKYESSPNTIIGERKKAWEKRQRGWEERNWHFSKEGICRELDIAKDKDSKGSYERPLATFLSRRKERYDNHRGGDWKAALFEAAYAIHYVTVLSETPMEGYEPPDWILEGLEKSFFKYRLYPNDAHFEWLDSQELKHKWKMDDSWLARCIWIKGLKWYALSIPNTDFPTPDWILEVSDQDVDFDGWKWLALGEITQKTILLNLDRMIFSLEEAEQFEKDHPELHIGKQAENGRGLRAHDKAAEQGGGQTFLSRLSPENHELLGQIYSEARILYLALKRVRVNGHTPDPEQKWKEAVLKYLESHQKDFKITERRDLDAIELYELNPGQSKRDFISKCCSNVFNRKTGMDIGARPLYEFLKKSVN